jgi:hypothetical protein
MTLAAQMIEAAVVGDAVQPRKLRFGCRQRRLVMYHAHEYLVQHVLGSGRVAQDAPTASEDQRAVTLVGRSNIVLVHVAWFPIRDGDEPAPIFVQRFFDRSLRMVTPVSTSFDLAPDQRRER